jgi:hypothetical protein
MTIPVIQDSKDVPESRRLPVTSRMPGELKLQGGRLVFFAYFGPETTLPLASVLAASLGFLMMMGRGSLRVVMRVVQAAFPRLKAGSKRNAVSPASHLTAGMRGDRPHQGGEVPGWLRPDRNTTSPSVVEPSRQEDESSNG